MLKNWEFLPDIFMTSSEKRVGMKEILTFIEKYNQSFDPTLSQ